MQARGKIDVESLASLLLCSVPSTVFYMINVNCTQYFSFSEYFSETDR